MSFVELIPAVRSLARSDKLRLIQWLAEDLASSEDSPLEPAGEVRPERGKNGDGEDDRVQEIVPAVAMRNAIGRHEDLGFHLPVEGGLFDPDSAMNSSRETSQPYPYWSPDREAEAAALLMKMLEAEKSKS